MSSQTHKQQRFPPRLYWLVPNVFPLSAPAPFQLELLTCEMLGLFLHRFTTAKLQEGVRILCGGLHRMGEGRRMASFPGGPSSGRAAPECILQEGARPLRGDSPTSSWGLTVD